MTVQRLWVYQWRVPTPKALEDLSLTTPFHPPTVLTKTLTAPEDQWLEDSTEALSP